ncbi:hypothetical protein [Luteibacter yeojuensis]|uniref:Uncharacterized protein n=1 Tax=Luteibacter yeojuensis TaxID=345309 RepID=A0A7X5QU17_9GAMM|nr:hypothetical protein [Luteibacter yeojuensis]NID15415.1 hypothetical protein [Luteibacter yeojuensis]
MNLELTHWVRVATASLDKSFFWLETLGCIAIEVVTNPITMLSGTTFCVTGMVDIVLLKCCVRHDERARCYLSEPEDTPLLSRLILKMYHINVIAD